MGFGDDLRKWTDENIFGTDAESRNFFQAASRDFVHGVYHVGDAVKDVATGQNSSENWKRAGDHFSGENVRGRKGSKGSH